METPVGAHHQVSRSIHDQKWVPDSVFSLAFQRPWVCDPSILRVRLPDHGKHFAGVLRGERGAGEFGGTREYGITLGG